MVAAPNACSQPPTVVIVPYDASIASATVRRAGWAVNFTSVTPCSLRSGFLAVPKEDRAARRDCIVRMQLRCQGRLLGVIERSSGEQAEPAIQATQLRALLDLPAPRQDTRVGVGCLLE